jgi:hypothetical protein
MLSKYTEATIRSKIATDDNAITAILAQLCNRNMAKEIAKRMI